MLSNQCIARIADVKIEGELRHRKDDSRGSVQNASNGTTPRFWQEFERAASLIAGRFSGAARVGTRALFFRER